MLPLKIGVLYWLEYTPSIFSRKYCDCSTDGTQDFEVFLKGMGRTSHTPSILPFSGLQSLVAEVCDARPSLMEG